MANLIAYLIREVVGCQLRCGNFRELSCSSVGTVAYNRILVKYKKEKINGNAINPREHP